MTFERKEHIGGPPCCVFNFARCKQLWGRSDSEAILPLLGQPLDQLEEVGGGSYLADFKFGSISHSLNGLVGDEAKRLVRLLQ